MQNLNSILTGFFKDPVVNIDLNVFSEISRMEIDLAFDMQSIQEALLIVDKLQNEARSLMCGIVERASSMGTGMDYGQH